MSSAVPDSNNSRAVLIIDDEYGARLQVELALANSKLVHVVGEAPNGMRGAELAEQLQPDIIVLDLSMPVMTGWEAMPLLQTLVPDAAILIRSADETPAAIERAARMGAVGFIPKMLHPDELRNAVEEAAQAHHRRNELLESIVQTAPAPDIGALTADPA